MKKIKSIDALILLGGICGIALAIERAAHEKWIGVLLFGVFGVSNIYNFANRVAAKKEPDDSAKK